MAISKKMSKDRTISLKLKSIIAKKCKFICQICGEKGIFYPESGHVLGQKKEPINWDCTIYAKIPMEYDHIFPLSKGGKTILNNLQLLCRNCNRKKKDKI